MDSGEPVVVELFGQPGAGKTTLARAATAGSRLRGTASLGADWKRLPLTTRLSLVGRAMLDGTCLAHAIRLAFTARLFRGDSLPRLVRLAIKSQWIRAQSGQLLLEEGCLQDLWSIHYSSGRFDPDTRRLAPLIRCLYRGVKARIVYVEIEPQIAFDRISSRKDGKSRLDRLAEADLRQHLADAANLPSRLVEAASLAGLRVETLDASQPLETSLCDLKAAVRELETLSRAAG